MARTPSVPLGQWHPDFEARIPDARAESARQHSIKSADASIPKDAATLVLPDTSNAVSSVKIAALYFPSVRIRLGRLIRAAKADTPEMGLSDKKGSHVITDIVDHLGREVLTSIQPLVHEDVVHLAEGCLNEVEREEFRSVARTARQLVLDNSNLVVRDVTAQDSSLAPRARKLKLDPEAMSVWQRTRWPMAVGASFENGYLEPYYGMLMTDLMEALAAGRTALTDSGVLSELLKLSLTAPAFAQIREQLASTRGIEPRLAQRVMQLSLPDMSALSCDDILEIRHIARAELERFHSSMLSVSRAAASSADEKELLNDIDLIAETQVLPALDDLERKAAGESLRASKRFIEALKSPAAGGSLIASLFAHVPAQYALLIGAGVAGIQTAIEMVESRRELRANGLYYLLRLRKTAHVRDSEGGAHV
ncbi:MAG: hypothetical protein NTX53_21910 [candidate division WOR-3 bacterium]|nr:hypothetical protein [candidate division WOR-3 bacterium]